MKLLGFKKDRKKRKESATQKRKRAAAEIRNASKRATKEKRQRFRFSFSKDIPDFNLVFLVTILFIGGLLMIFSASAIIAYSRYDGDSFYFFKKQIQWLILGVVLSIFFYYVPPNVLRKLSALMLAGTIVLLLYMLPEALFGKTFFDEAGNTIEGGIQMPFVAQINGATRWINLGSFSLQPSEIVKFSLIIYMSAWLTRDFRLDPKNLFEDHFKKILIPFMCLSGFICLLILGQRDFDTTVIIFLAIMTVYYMSGSDRIHTYGSIAILSIAVLLGSMALVMEDYRRERVACFVDIAVHGIATDDKAKGSCYQVWNGLIAIGSGGIDGVGYGESIRKQGYLQDAAFTDSIFVVIAEEFGFIGIIFLVAGFLYFTSLGLKIARRAETPFETLLAIGMTSWISIQAFFNMAANLAIIPFGGMPLPFFTYGGSSTLVTIMSVAVLLNISKRSKVKV